jgi:hypothetical protein
MRVIVMDMGKDAVETKGCKLLLDAFQFVGIRRHNRMPKRRGVLKLVFD